MRLHPSPSQAWHTEALWQALQPVWPDLQIEVLAEIGSTNVELVERLRVAASAAQGHALRDQDLRPCLLVAERQTAGRGRLGRVWQSSPKASLTCSLSLPIARQDWSGLSLCVGLALAESIDPTGAFMGLKWPNDLWCRDGSARKLGGILIEGLSVGGQRMAVIGMGLNVTAAAPEHACLAETLPDITPPDVLARMMPALAKRLQQFEAQGFAGMREDYVRRDILCGMTLHTTDAQHPQGVAQGVDGDGALLLRTPQGLQRIVSGEVSVRPADQPLPPPST